MTGVQTCALPISAVILGFAAKRFIPGDEALINNKPCPENHKLPVPRAIEEKIVYLRSTYHFGPDMIDMIVWHLQRYHDIKVSRNGCYQVLKRNKLNRLPENIKKRSRNKFTRFD